MPETAGCGRVGVETGNGEAMGILREPAPGQLRRDVLAAGAHDPADLRLGQGLAFGHVGARDRECRNLRQEVVRGGCGHCLALLYSLRLCFRLRTYAPVIAASPV